MNKELLLAIIYRKDIKNFDLKLQEIRAEFSNILIINQMDRKVSFKNDCFVIKSYQRNIANIISNFINDNNQKIKYVAIIDEVNCITVKSINKCYDAAKDNGKVVLGVSKNNSKFNDLFNLIFNTNIQNKIINIKVLKPNLLEKRSDLIDTRNCTSLSLKNDVEEIFLEEGEKSTLINSLKEKLIFSFKGILPYLIAILLFILIFHLRKSVNDLEGIIIANLLAEGVGIGIHVALNYSDIYKLNKISSNLLFLLRKLCRIVLSCFLIYIGYNIIGIDLLLCKIISDLSLLIVITLLFKKFV